MVNDVANRHRHLEFPGKNSLFFRCSLPTATRRVLCDLVLNVARLSGLNVKLSAELRGCEQADESGRRSEKNREQYPRQKRSPSTGERSVWPIKPELLQRALTLLLYNHYPR